MHRTVYGYVSFPVVHAWFVHVDCRTVCMAVHECTALVVHPLSVRHTRSSFPRPIRQPPPMSDIFFQSDMQHDPPLSWHSPHTGTIPCHHSPRAGAD
jgi:hypothetical protein